MLLGRKNLLYVFNVNSPSVDSFYVFLHVDWADTNSVMLFMDTRSVVPVSGE